MGVFSTGLKYVLKDFSCWTSTHGVPHIGMANAMWLRGFWVLVVLGCIAAFIWQFQTLLAKYLAFTVNTETKLQFSERVFPTVSMCHLNPWKLTEVTTDPVMNKLITAYNTRIDDPEFGFEDGLTGERQRRAVQWTALNSEKLYEYTGAPIAYSYEDLVISCTYNAKTCNLTDFVEFYDPTYGQCQRFNYEAQFSSSRAGPLYGLRMVIRTDQATYLPWTETAGVVIVIHGEDEIPYPDVLGYFAPPGTASSMGVRYLSTSRKPAPYGTCTTQETLETPQFKGAYSVEACFRSCIQQKIIDSCSCYDPAYPHEDVTIDSCASNNLNTAAKNMECIETNTGLGAEFNVIRDCDCPQPCEVETYSITVSTAQWPSNAFKPQECNQAAVGKPWTTGDGCIDWYKKNTLLVEIYYERMNYQVLTESPAYSLVNLVSDVGGQVGLFLGMSIISLIEFTFLIFLICAYCATHKSRRVELEELANVQDKAKKESAAVARKAELERLKAEKARELYATDHDVIPPAITDAP